MKSEVNFMIQSKDAEKKFREDLIWMIGTWDDKGTRYNIGPFFSKEEAEESASQMVFSRGYIITTKGY